ncbi:MAG: AraC family transcriptional regulator [Clostridiales bacterium]|jgi:AraC-like DNA-binding protein|nr:AraC family transcriptional regulator [Clostridiales bacterium]
MDQSDVHFAAACIAGISAIPIRVYQHNRHVKSYGLENMPVDPVRPYEELLLGKDDPVNYCGTPFSQFYGSVRHGEMAVIIGPIGQTDFTPQEKRNYAFALGLPPLDFDDVLAAMRHIPKFTPENFLHMLLLINFYFNGEKKDISEITAHLQINGIKTITERPGGPEAQEDEGASPHYTRAYEREMLNFVREGDTGGLKRFLSSRIHGAAGVLSKEQVRQQKNLFIVAATLVSRAAMDGGLYEDEAFTLSDMYIRRCEELFSVEALLRLSYEMAMDFAARVFETGRQTTLNPLVASVITYIRRNISGNLSCEALAKRFSLHRNSLSAQFKADTGKSLSDFVFNEKMRRAKSLLVNTDKSLSSIADYLGFSSQSHFQNAFKRHMNRTPSGYRAEAKH